MGGSEPTNTRHVASHAQMSLEPPARHSLVVSTSHTGNRTGFLNAPSGVLLSCARHFMSAPSVSGVLSLKGEPAALRDRAFLTAAKGCQRPTSHAAEVDMLQTVA